jgi:S-formylglutathione hydrolase FrmB
MWKLHCEEMLVKPNPARFVSKTTLPLLALAGATALLCLQPIVEAQIPGSDKTGTIEKIKVHGTSLEGNLEGDPADRDVFVYLPPSYASPAGRRYPVVYFLHGYGATAEAYWKLMVVPDASNKVMNAGTVHEMIVVLPDAHTIDDGSMYSNSPTTGDWEGYITRDLVAYIDSHYRTIANRESRGLAGHSMGGYGTLRLAMKYPDVFSSIYAMSSCCLMNNPGAGRGGAPAGNGRGEGAGRGGRGGGFANALNAQAAAWAPNPMNPRSSSTCPRRMAPCAPRSRPSGSPTLRWFSWISTFPT